MTYLKFFTGFYHEVTRLDRESFVDVDYDEIKNYEIATYGGVTNRKKRQYVRCDRTKLSRKIYNTDKGTIITKGCRKIGTYDGNSILHYPTTLLINVEENGTYVDKNLTVLTLKQKAHDLCENGKCNPGQREGLSINDIKDIELLYGTNCCKYHSKLTHK